MLDFIWFLCETPPNLAPERLMVVRSGVMATLLTERTKETIYVHT